MKKACTFIFILASTTIFSKPVWATSRQVVSHQLIDLLESSSHFPAQSSQVQDEEDEEDEFRSNYEALSTWRNRDTFLEHLIDDDINQEQALRYFANEAVGQKRRSCYDRMYLDFLSAIYGPSWYIQNIVDQYIDAYSDASRLLQLASSPEGKLAMLDGYVADSNKDYFKYLSPINLRKFKHETDWYENISRLLATETKDQKNIEWLLENSEFSRKTIKAKFPQPDDRIKARDKIIKRDGYRIARLIQHMPPTPDGTPYTKEMITTRFPTILLRKEAIERLRESDAEYIERILEMSMGPSVSRYKIEQQFKTIFERQNEFYRLKQPFDLLFPHDLLGQLLTEISGYQTILTNMRINHKVEATTYEEHKAMDQAFWKNIADFISKMEAINPEEILENRKYLNIVKFLTTKYVDDLIFDSTEVGYEEWVSIEADLIDLTKNLGISNIPQEEGEVTQAPSLLISDWLNKLMECKQSKTPEGKNFIRNRVKNIVGFLKDIDEEKRKLIIQKDIIDNGQNCSDRALSGLDNAEIMIKIMQAKTIPEMLGAIIQKFKKNVLEMILDRGRNEIVEEYLYLALMFNNHLALGLPTTNIGYAHFGNHKTFDEALKKFLEHIHYEGIINVIMAEEVWWKAVQKNISINKTQVETPEDQRYRSFKTLENGREYISLEQYNQKIEEIGQVYRKAIEDPIRAFTKEIFDAEFLLNGSKDAELFSEEAVFVAQEHYTSTLQKLEKARDDAQKSLPPRNGDYFIKNFVDYAGANENLNNYQQKYGHLFTQEIQNEY